MKYSIILLTLLFALTVSAQKVRVACIGNSITYGHGIEDRQHDTYPAQLQAMLGDAFQVENFGVSGTTAQREGNSPWVSKKEYQAAKDFQPQVAVIKLGTNDSKSMNWVSTERFINDLEALALEFENLDSHPQIIICLPAKAYEVRWDIRDSIIVRDQIPAIRKMAKRHHWTLIDLHKTTSNMPQNFPDGIHPNPAGANIIATTVAKAVKKISK